MKTGGRGRGMDNDKGVFVVRDDGIGNFCLLPRDRHRSDYACHALPISRDRHRGRGMENDKGVFVVRDDGIGKFCLLPIFTGPLCTKKMI